ncbi:MAG: EthD family reductase [Gaiellales bacterium]
MIKVIGTAYKRDDFETKEFFDYWRDVHAPVSSKTGPMRGYVVSEVLRKLQGEIEADAFVEQWWDDEEAFERAAETPEMAAAWEDVGNYAKQTGTFWIVKEHVYIPPPITGAGTLSSNAWLA